MAKSISMMIITKLLKESQAAATGKILCLFLSYIKKKKKKSEFETSENEEVGKGKGRNDLWVHTRSLQKAQASSCTSYRLISFADLTVLENGCFCDAFTVR